jgi:O-antigen ligase
MVNLTQYLLWAYVFTLSWDNVPLPFIGSISRAIGLAVTGAAILTTMIHGRFRRPDRVLVLAIAFATWSALTVLWTVSYADTVTRAFTYGQVVVSAWLIREFIRTREQVEPLMVAFCFGSVVPITSLLINFWTGAETQDASRFTASDLNPNVLGVILVIGLPMAWYLLMHRRGAPRIIAMIYWILAPLCMLLTGTRGGFVAALVAAAIVPLTIPRSIKSYASAGAIAVVAVAAIVIVVPRENWERMGTISSEVTEGGRLSGRTDIWSAGLSLYPEHPILGIGAGAYAVTVQPLLRSGKAMVSHNTALGLLVEEGIVGLCIFAALLAASAWTIAHFPPPYRVLWGVTMATWFVGAMDGNFEHVKITWVLIGLISAQAGLKDPVTSVVRMRTRSAHGVSARPLYPASLSRNAQL